jgi:hypothetical protein
LGDPKEQSVNTDISKMLSTDGLVMWGYNIYDLGSSQVRRALSGDTHIEA